MAMMTQPGQETLGQRIAQLRKERGYTQVEVAEKIGIIQVLVLDYERDKLRPHPEVIVRFAQALDVTIDELLGFKASPTAGTKPSLKTLRRLKKIENLPPSQQKALFKTIDNFLTGVEMNKKTAEVFLLSRFYHRFWDMPISRYTGLCR